MSSSYSTYKVDRISLLLDVFGPNAEDVAALVHINIVTDSRYVGFQSFLIVRLKLFFNLRGMVQMSTETFNFTALFNIFFIFDSLKLLSLGFFASMLISKFGLFLS